MVEGLARTATLSIQEIILGPKNNLDLQTLNYIREPSTNQEILVSLPYAVRATSLGKITYSLQSFYIQGFGTWALGYMMSST